MFCQAVKPSLPTVASHGLVSVRETKLEVFKEGILRAEDLSDVTITVFPTAQSDASVNRFPR